jgi:hypothetical protein
MDESSCGAKHSQCFRRSARVFRPNCNIYECSLDIRYAKRLVILLADFLYSQLTRILAV